MKRWSTSRRFDLPLYDVTEAADGESAIRTLTDGSDPFDVVLLDYRLPDSNDLGLLSTIRRIAPKSAVIVMTAIWHS